MRKPDNTLIFGSKAAPPASVRAPVSLRAPASRPLEKQWFNKPVDMTPPSIRRPLSDDLDRRGFIPRSPERGLAFAAVALALIGVAGAGTYFFFGTDNTAHNEPTTTSTTTLTNADVPATTETAVPTPTPAPVVSPADLPWAPPVVEAVKEPNLPQQLRAPQVLPTARPVPAATAPATTETGNEESHAAIYPSTATGDLNNTVTPPPIQTLPSAGNADVTTHMAPDSNTDNTVRNPSGEPALSQGIKQ